MNASLARRGRGAQAVEQPEARRLEDQDVDSIALDRLTNALTARSRSVAGRSRPGAEFARALAFEYAIRDDLNQRVPRVLAVLSPRALWNYGFEQVVVEQPGLDIRRNAAGRRLKAGRYTLRLSVYDSVGNVIQSASTVMVGQTAASPLPGGSPIAHTEESAVGRDIRASGAAAAPAAG